jgi:tetratricopeptide (TPR) repeat protein
LSESRAVVHYLYDLAIPKLYSGSLFNDDFVISKNLITPYTTSYSIIFIATLIGVAVKTRAKYPLASLGILFFFCGHLLESTTIPLDIYYEHRNYLPSVFLFLPLAYLADLSPKPTLVAATCLALLMAGFTAAKAKLWRSEPELLLLWSSQHPDSIRAQRYASTVYFKVGDYDRALSILDSVILKHPTDVKTRLHQLVFLCSSDRSGEVHLNSTIAAIHATPVHLDGQLLEMLEQLVTSAGQQKCPAISLADIDKLTDAVIGHLSNTSDTTKYFVLTHIKGMIALYRHDPSLALDYFSRTLAQSRNPETGLLEAAMLASNGYLAEAEQHINSTDELFKSNPDRFSGITARHNFADEIAYLRREIQSGTK